MTARAAVQQIHNSSTRQIPAEVFGVVSEESNDQAKFVHYSNYCNRFVILAIDLLQLIRNTRESFFMGPFIYQIFDIIS